MIFSRMKVNYSSPIFLDDYDLLYRIYSKNLLFAPIIFEPSKSPVTSSARKLHKG